MSLYVCMNIMLCCANVITLCYINVIMVHYNKCIILW